MNIAACARSGGAGIDSLEESYFLAAARGAETIEARHDRSWGARVAYLTGAGGLTVELEQLKTHLDNPAFWWAASLIRTVRRLGIAGEE